MRRKRSKAATALLTIGAVLCVAAAVCVVWLVALIGIEYSAKDDYRQLAALAEQADEVAESPIGRDVSMRTVNDDYVCWASVAGTAVDYPVARAEDNEKYLTTSFMGEKSPAGAIFLDYRCAAGLTDPHIIIYGHNAKNGEMFGGLRQFTDAAYLAAHPAIELTFGGETYSYEIFAARKTDIYDPAYQLDFPNAESLMAFLAANNAPPDAAQILTLSTCVSAWDKRERFIVQGALMAP